MSQRGRNPCRGNYRQNERSESRSSSSCSSTSSSFYTDARRVTPQEAAQLRQAFNPNPNIPTKKYDGPTGPALRSTGVIGVDDGQTHMLPFESKDGNEDRNIGLSLIQKKGVGAAIRKQLEQEEIMAEQIRASFYVRSNCDTDDETPLPFNRQFLVVHFGIYCQTAEGFHPGEFGIASFSIRDGIRRCYGRMLDPGKIPFGFRSDFHSAAEEKGYEIPVFDPNTDFNVHCLDIIQKFLEMSISDYDPQGVLYTSRPDVDIVKGSLKFAAMKTGRALNFKVFPLSRLIELLLIEGEHLRCLNRVLPSSIVFSEENAIALMVDGKWNDYKELGCRFHQHSSKTRYLDHCSMSLVKRWIYNSMGLLCKMYCCPMYLHTHIPKVSPPPKLAIDVCPELPNVSAMDLRSELESVSHERVRGYNIASSSSSNVVASGSIASNSTPQSAPRSLFSPRSEILSHDSANASDNESNVGTTVGVSADEDSCSVISDNTSTYQSTAPPARRETRPIWEAGEPPITELFSTSEGYPVLEGIVATPLNSGLRSMEIFQMPDMSQRRFPDSFDLIEFVPGKKVSARVLPQPLTVFTFEDETELVPLVSDFSFKSRKGSHRPERDRPLSRAESEVSIYSLCSSIDTNISSVSQHDRSSYDPLRKVGMKQAEKVLTQGVLPQTKFVYTGKLFWDDGSSKPTVRQQQGGGPRAPLGRQYHRGNMNYGRGHGRLYVPVALPPQEPEQPIGMGRAQRAEDFWRGVIGYGRGRESDPNELCQPPLPTCGVISFANTPDLQSDDDDSSSVSASMDQRRDIDYYRTRFPSGYDSDSQNQ